jgi:hypothetical protein
VIATRGDEVHHLHRNGARDPWAFGGSYASLCSNVSDG